MRISHTLVVALLPFTWLAGCAGQTDPESTGATQTPAVQVPEPEACDAWGDTRACTTTSGESGVSQCTPNADRDFQLYYSQCDVVVDCSPGETQDCGFTDPTFGGLTRGCVLNDGGWVWDEFGCNTPLVLSFDNTPVTFTQASGWFDLVGAGVSVNHDWVSPRTPWLVLDRNGNGSVDDGSELFGSMTVLGSGTRAPHGFAALSELDANRDQRIDADDELFSRLVLWSDRNQDRQSTPDELELLAENAVTALSLTFARSATCTSTACEVERASFEYTDIHGNTQRGSTIDVHFKTY